MYAPVSGDDVPRLAALRRRTIKMDSRSVILRENQVPDEVYTLFDGWAFRYKLLADGRRQILSFLLPGDFVTLQALRSQPLLFSVQALTPVKLCAFDREEIADFLCTRLKLLQNVAGECLRVMAASDLRVIDLGRGTALERVARFVLKIEARMKARNIANGDSWRFPLRQEHIADSLGLTTVHVSRTMASLRNRGLISLRHGAITIENRAQLEKLVGPVGAGVSG